MLFSLSFGKSLTHSLVAMLVPQQVIDLQSENQIQTSINFNQQYYFGTFQLTFSQNLLKVTFEFKRHLVSSQLENQQISMIDRQQYNLTKMLQLNITWPKLSPALQKQFASLRVFATFLIDEIGNPDCIEIDREKLTIKLRDKPVSYLYFSLYKKLDKNQLIHDMKRLQDTFSSITQADMNLVDPDIVLAAGTTFSEQDIVRLYLGENQNEEQSSGFSSESKNEESESENKSNEKTSVVHQDDNQTAKIFGSQFKFTEVANNRFQGIVKQNEIPIYQRFRGLNINIPRKEKMKLAQKMLRIGYNKEEIIRFFSGAAEQMEAEGNRIPDYRNPETARYQEIHLLVAKRQYARHNQLLKRHGKPPVAQLDQYSGELVITRRPQLTDQRRVKQLLIKFIKQKRFKRLDDIHLEIKRNGVETTLPYLKKLVQELKQKSQQKKAKVLKNQQIMNEAVEIN